MKRLTAIIVLAALLGALSGQHEAMAQETIYKWVDQEGTVHYGARPPEGVDYEIVDIETRERTRGGASTDGDEAGPDAGEESEDGTTVPPEQPEMAASEPDPEMVAERCAQARRNIENLTQRSNVLIRGEDGERRQISAEERESMLEDARRFIDEWC